MTETIPEVLREALQHLKLDQLSARVLPMLERLVSDVKAKPTPKEGAMLLNPTEVAAILSLKYRRPIKSSYIKELTRPVRNEKTGHVTPARLQSEKRSGNSLLYRAKSVFTVQLRADRMIESE